jgi:hypothetical protein
MKIRIIKHEAKTEHGSLKSGSFEVRRGDEKHFFYWDDVAGRRVRAGQTDQATALERAKEFARQLRDSTTKDK